MTRDRREYMREYNRKYKAEHREQSREYWKKYNAEHREQRREYDRKYYAEHLEHRLEYQRKYYAEHSEQGREYRRKYYAEHSEQENQRSRIYRKKMKLAKKLGLVSVKGKFNTPEQVKSTVTAATAPKKKHHSAVYARSDRATRHEQLMARRDKFRDFVGETLAEYDHQKSLEQYERELEHHRKYNAKHREQENAYKRQQYADKKRLRSAADD